MSRLRSPIAPKERPPTADAPEGLDLSALDMSGNVIVDRRHVKAWYRLGPKRIGYEELDDQERIFAQIRAAHAGLANRGELHFRATSRPFAAHEWARGHMRWLDSLGLKPPDRDEQLARLDAETRHVRRTAGPGDMTTYVGVTLTDRDTWDGMCAALGRGAAVDRELRKLTGAMTDTDRVMARPGLAGTPVTFEERDWLMHRSVGMFLPAPARLGSVDHREPEDMFTFTDGVWIDPNPRGAAVRVISAPWRTGGKAVERWVVVLAFGRHQDLVIPEVLDPWAAAPQQLGIPYELSVRAHIEDAAKAGKRLDRRIKYLIEQQEQGKHPDTPPDPLLPVVKGRADARAMEIAEGDPASACGITWQGLAAVSGRTETEALQHADDFTALFHPQWNIEHLGAQYAHFRSFIPGERQASTAHTRRGGIGLFCAGLPTMSARMGDEVGHRLGYTAGTVYSHTFWDLIRGIKEGESPGFTPVIASSGGGKSTLAAKLMNAAPLDGLRTTALDPTGQLARVARLPRHRNHAFVLDPFAMPRGSLSPYSLIPEPDRADCYYDDRVALAEEGTDVEALVEELFAEARKDAEARRRQLAIDTLRLQLAKKQFRARTDSIIMAAVMASPAKIASSLYSVLDRMEGTKDPEAVELARFFRDLSELPGPSKFFSQGPFTSTQRTTFDDALLAVISLEKAELPDEGTDPDSWTQEERQSVAMLNLCAQLMARRVYGRPFREPGLVIFDEMGLLGHWPSGKRLILRLAVDARKRLKRILALGQDPDMVLALRNISAVISDGFVGWTDSREVAKRCLQMLRVPTTRRYVDEVVGLSPKLADGSQAPNRTFLARLNGKVGQVAIDMSDDPGLLAAATPGTPMPGDRDWVEPAA